MGRSSVKLAIETGQRLLNPVLYVSFEAWLYPVAECATRRELSSIEALRPLRFDTEP